MIINSVDQEAVRELMSSVRIGSEQAIHDVKNYISANLIRFSTTLKYIPLSPQNGRLLDIGGLANLVPCYKQMLGYQSVSISTASKDSPFVPEGLEESLSALKNVDVAYFNLEFDRFPYPDEYFDTIVCCEVLEHLTTDPMAMLAEVNRVLKGGGHFLMTTPNVVSWFNLARAVAGKQPIAFHDYSAVNSDRHNREYTPREVTNLFRDAGFENTTVTTFNQSGLEPGHKWLKWCLKPMGRYFNLPKDEERGEFIIGVGRKVASVRDRLPDWLYGQFAEDRDLLVSAGKYTLPR